MLEQSIAEGLYSIERVHAGAVLEELQPRGKTHVGEINEGLYPMRGSSCWSGEEP